MNVRKKMISLNLNAFCVPQCVDMCVTHEVNIFTVEIHFLKSQGD